MYRLMRCGRSQRRTGAAEVSGLVDVHVHAWDRSRFAYGWLDGESEMAVTALPGAYAADAPEVTGCIFVEAAVDAGAEVDEVRWAARSFGGTWPDSFAVVAAVDVFDPELPTRVDVLSDAAEGRLVGVRYLLQDVPDDRLDSAAFRRGLGHVAARGLVFDVCVRWRQLDAVAELLEGMGRGRFVLDHLGKPPVGSDQAATRAWQKSITRLAQLPNLSVKLSGLPAEAASREQLREFAPELLAHAVASFGSNRCMFASDWPVSVRAPGGVPTGEWLEIVRGAVPVSQWDAVASETARAVYRIGE